MLAAMPQICNTNFCQLLDNKDFLLVAVFWKVEFCTFNFQNTLTNDIVKIDLCKSCDILLR